MSTPVEKAFALQARWCRELGSPFTAALVERLAADIAAGGPTAALIQGWTGEWLADAAALRLAAALHAAALSRRDADLAAQYPGQRPDWEMDALWPLARAFLSREQAWVKAFIANAPQTNETRRAVALAPGFLEAAQGAPIHWREIGASAGLNLCWPHFRYRTNAWSWGEGAGPLIDTDWQGPAPSALAHPFIAGSAAGCDVNPLDVRNASERVRLKSYVWADQADRLARIDAAIARAIAETVRVERADAGDWLARTLAGDLPEGVTVIYHSVVWQYLPETTKAAAEAAIADAASRARPDRRLAWLRFEPKPVLDPDGPKEGFAVDLAVWPAGARRRLAETDGHARRLVWLAG